MIDVRGNSLVSDEDFQLCKILVEDLEPHLASAKMTPTWLLPTQQKLVGYNAVIKRVHERRNEEVIWLMKYLLTQYIMHKKT